MIGLEKSCDIFKQYDWLKFSVTTTTLLQICFIRSGPGRSFKKRFYLIFSKQSDLERKKADVRKRMEEQSMAKKKKGFMTPERKKKLRVSLALFPGPGLKEPDF